MPITWLTCLIGALALIGFPGFSGFFSKDAIIEAVHLSTLPAADFAYYAVMTGVVITALYTFRLFFLVFHGKERMDKETWSHLHEAPAVVWVPLSMLAVPAFIIGFFLVGPMLFSEYFADAIYVAPAHDVLAEMGHEYHGIFSFILHAFKQPPVYLAFVGLFLAWLFYIRLPDLPKKIAGLLRPLYFVLVKKYGMDEFNQIVFAGGVRRIGNFLWDIGDVKFIDGLFVNGSALSVQWFSGVVRKLQSGYLYHYAFAMIFALLILIFFFVHI
jgi:NADH-quinone oxidoreductase subunit L